MGIHGYGVASSSRLLKIISLFCKRALLKGRYSAKETYHFKEPTDRSHPISPTANSLYNPPHTLKLDHIKFGLLLFLLFAGRLPDDL